MRWVVALGLLSLAACDPWVRRSEVEAIAADEARDEVAHANARITELVERVDELETQMSDTEVSMASVNRSLDATADQVTFNAKTQNANAIADMTRRGACGTETVQIGTGYLTRNKECTRADLKP